jgi:hypothetical protein
MLADDHQVERALPFVFGRHILVAPSLDPPISISSSSNRPMEYFADASTRGHVRYREMPNFVGVFESPHPLVMIGFARKVGRTADDMAVWSLRVDTVDVPGYWVIVDRRFVPVEYSAPIWYLAFAKFWNALQVAGFFGVRGGLAWAITIWITGDEDQVNRFLMPGVSVALGSFALMMCGRLGVWWFQG